MAARTGAGGDSACLGCQAETPTANSQSSDGKPSVTAERRPPSTANGCSCATTVVATHHFQHVIIVLENTDVETARKIDYFRQLAAEGASFADFHGVTHPSYSNYLAMVAGRNIFSLWDIQRNLERVLDRRSAARQGPDLEELCRGLPRAFRPANARRPMLHRGSSGRYARKHVPFMSFIRVQQKQCGNIVSASAFDSDRASGNLPNYAFYSPDLDHDGHDTGIAKAAIWLQGFLDPLHADGAWPEDTLIVVTFDEFGRSIIELRQSHLYRAARQHDQAGHDHPRAARSLRRVADDRGQFRALPLADGDGAARPITGIWK